MRAPALHPHRVDGRKRGKCGVRIRPEIKLTLGACLKLPVSHRVVQREGSAHALEDDERFTRPGQMAAFCGCLKFSVSYP